MESIAKSDIFFFITTIAVIVITLFVVLLAVYAVRIMSDVKFISKKVKEESVEFLEDAKEMRQEIRDKGTSLLGILSLIFGSKKKNKRKK